MSYDITIRSDEQFSDHISKHRIFTSIRQIAYDVKFDGTFQFISEIEKRGYYFDINVESVTNEGDSIVNNNKIIPKQFNCIRCHYCGELTEENLKLALYTAYKIAISLNWNAYDEQTGENISFTEKAKPWWQFW